MATREGKKRRRAGSSDRTSSSSRRKAERSKLARTKPVRATGRQAEALAHALHALALMRHGKSMSEACRLEHLKPATFRRLVGRAVRQDRVSGRVRALRRDRLVANLEVPSARGPVRKFRPGAVPSGENSRTMRMPSGISTAQATPRSSRPSRTGPLLRRRANASRSSPTGRS
jgi:hypothetical protein